MLDAALAGFGLAYLPEDSVQPHLADGSLIRVLADWCHRSQAITCITRAGANRRRRSRCWSMRCAIAADGCGAFVTVQVIAIAHRCRLLLKVAGSVGVRGAHGPQARWLAQRKQGGR